jgi:hypothetical protein
MFNFYFRNINILQNLYLALDFCQRLYYLNALITAATGHVVHRTGIIK